jgi:DNA-binding response OmpR family regulator
MVPNLQLWGMKKKVLVVEDEPIIAEMMSLLLEIEGYNVISSSDIAYARRKLHQKDIHLVMLDLKLKDEDGRSMCAYIKGHDELKSIPVIFVSANSDLEQITKDCGADDHINKPFDMATFMSKVRAFT